MSVQHHPDQDLLLAYAVGGLEVSVALIVASHLHFCSNCRKDVALAEQIGSILINEISPAALEAGTFSAVSKRLDGVSVARTVSVSNDNTPGPLRAFMDGDISQVKWRKMGPRLGFVNLYRRGALAMRLVRGAPGSNVGLHSHRGTEYTLVLRGGYTDATGSYGVGDFQAASANMKHDPVADLDGDCINLMVSTDPYVFDGIIQKVVGRLFGFS